MTVPRDPADHRTSASDGPTSRGRGPRTHRRHKAAASATGSAKLPTWQLLSVYWGTAALASTGVVALLLHQFGQTQTEFGPGPNPMEHPLLALHGGAAMAFLILLGSLLPAHILRGWQQRRNWTSGLSMLAIQALLIVTAYGLYYASGDALRALISLVHWVIGLLIIVVLPWHVVAGRRRRAAG